MPTPRPAVLGKDIPDLVNVTLEGGVSAQRLSAPKLGAAEQRRILDSINAAQRRDAAHARLSAALEGVLTSLREDPATVDTLEDMAAFLHRHLATHPHLIGRFISNTWIRRDAMPILRQKWSGTGRIDPPSYDELAETLNKGGLMPRDRKRMRSADGTKEKTMVYLVTPLEKPALQSAEVVPLRAARA